MRERTYLFTTGSTEENAKNAMEAWRLHPTYHGYQSLRGGYAVVPPRYDVVFAAYHWKPLDPGMFQAPGEAREGKDTQHSRETGNGRKGDSGASIHGEPGLRGQQSVRGGPPTTTKERNRSIGTAGKSRRYPFSVYEFTSCEIDQIVVLVREGHTGRVLPIDKRKYSRQVLEYAWRWGITERRGDGREVCRASGRINSCYDLPGEALWRMVAPMLRGQRSIGKSIARDRMWLDLNIWPEGNRYASATSLEEQEAVLDTLARMGYLIVQRAGSVWEITRRREGEQGTKRSPESRRREMRHSGEHV